MYNVTTRDTETGGATRLLAQLGGRWSGSIGHIEFSCVNYSTRGLKRRAVDETILCTLPINTVHLYSLR